VGEETPTTELKAKLEGGRQTIGVERNGEECMGWT